MMYTLDSHSTLNALSLYKAGFVVPGGTRLFGLHMSVDRGMTIGPSSFAAEDPNCSNDIHQLVACLSGTRRTMLFCISLPAGAPD
jgi:hypothetical protein